MDIQEAELWPEGSKHRQRWNSHRLAPAAAQQPSHHTSTKCVFLENDHTQFAGWTERKATVNMRRRNKPAGPECCGERINLSSRVC